ncbi:MAG: MoaD/ThiS family protein [Planctomycetes bacterium]|nr:MoaD/ThiS family protein [Planctomycetota bacterium]
MNVKVRFFGFMAERTGRREMVVEVPEPATVARVLKATGLSIPKSVRAAVNTDYADPSAPVRRGDIVSLIPPVGGG